ncbi:type VII secretion protein EssC [Streptococcus panodentis]|uniref:Type VII secretion protein EssC n=1 Tax=Streptococcus panodentis TaxID=1581472 RepID=A0ABS5B001_9STRE|nr:type VII secretion protein EssC [Streptococcus panodentis]
MFPQKTNKTINLGCSLIFVQDVMSSLSENIKTVINIKDRNTGQLVMEEGILRETDFQLDHFPAGYDREDIARTLAPLHHLQNLKSSIPDTVTFMEMYGAETFADLQVLQKWQQNAPYKSLAVPIGLRGKEDLVYLNLHEKAHGPHGLIAGTTGSGKSETIQSYILSLAVNFHPHDVAFLLIDYKGGGMANLFKNLPHLLGTITNLDGAQSMRALASINAEIHRRERLFREFEVNHINQYQKKYKNGEATEPLPHFFLISDEFAELKVNQPDFIKELVSIARVGRSLGVHLILATQKPSGVVDDQIWSNSRFKLALKVADRADSMEMLHTPDAAEITQTGRAYLQVGNNEVYELFQAAWSGADYQPDKDELGIEDHTIYLINDLGQYEVLNQDLSGLDLAEDIKEVPTELEAIVSQIQLLTESQQIAPVPQPWLPPLRERIYLPDLRKGNFKELWKHTNRSLKAILGYIDLPSQQTQYTLEHDFNNDGNIALFGGPLTGKSNFIQTLTMDLARQFTPEQIHFYLLDFGTNGLLPLRQLPHVADTVMIDDQEKITKFLSRMKSEIRYRKTLLRKYMVANINLYREVSGQQIPNIVIMLDSYDSVKESSLVMDLENTFQTIAREGLSLGIYFIITAGRIGVVKAALLASIKTRISLKLTDDTDTRALIGRTQLILEDKPGRAMIKLDEPEIFQMALPTKGDTAIDVIEQIGSEGKKMSEHWKGQRPKAIPIVPEELAFDVFTQNPSVQQASKQNQLPLGLDFVKVESVNIPLTGFKHLLYISDNEEHLENMTRHLLEVITELVPSKKVMFMDMDDTYGGQFDLFARVSKPETLKDMANQLMLELEDRKKGEAGHDFIIFIPDLEKFVEVSGLTTEQVSTLYQEGWKYNMHFVVGSMYSYISNNTVGTPVRQIKTYNQHYLLGMRLTDQTVLEKPFNSKEPYLNKDEVYLYGRQSSIKLKITK